MGQSPSLIVFQLLKAIFDILRNARAYNYIHMFVPLVLIKNQINLLLTIA
jgi:hypothetical protein